MANSRPIYSWRTKRNTRRLLGKVRKDLRRLERLDLLSEPQKLALRPAVVRAKIFQELVTSYDRTIVNLVMIPLTLLLLILLISRAVDVSGGEISGTSLRAAIAGVGISLVVLEGFRNRIRGILTSIFVYLGILCLLVILYLANDVGHHFEKSSEKSWIPWPSWNIKISHDWLKDVAIGLAGGILIALSMIFLSIALSVVETRLFNAAVVRLAPERLVISGLITAILSIGSTDTQLSWKRRIRAASALTGSAKAMDHMGRKTPMTEVAEGFRRRANYLRGMSGALTLSKESTQGDTVTHLMAFTIEATRGNLSHIPEAEGESAVMSSRRLALRSTRAVLVGLFPIAAILTIERFVAGFDGPVVDYLKITAATWLIVSITSIIDSSSSQRIPLIGGWLNRPS
ncbi:hypothetical protein [Pseudofrankia sp. BMG5.36]|uniref:hypothetical protein n=1 Tax=Pseudofrankia sp. BMG5.36 TaxID=1834512 RepID=UPI001041F15D|nr:hypothetical protein [Pseudofrankia sp. BMG5.36]